MDLQSPLTQQSRPDYFEPKVVSLYGHLFDDAAELENQEGFWRELFLLKPDIGQFRRILEDLKADDLLHNSHQTREFVLQAIAAIRSASAPADENALDTLAVFFSVVLTKRYTNPSSDIIDVLAGLDNVDIVFSDLVAVLERATVSGRDVATRQKAARAAIAVVAGGYQTALVSYFVHRDLFPALMGLIKTLDDPSRVAEPFLLVGLLANYDKFETHNQYRVRLADFVDEDAMQSVVMSIGWTCTQLRKRYIDISDDTPAVWSIGGTLSYVGLGALAGAKPAPAALSDEQQRTLFNEQPGTEAASLLGLYDFVLANRVFSQQFISHPALDKDQVPPFSAFLSYSSYLFQHAYRSTRSSMHAYLVVLILWILAEDPVIAKLLCDTNATVRLCRQRPPYLPIPAKSERPYVVAIIDVLIDGINHNLRKRLDVGFYNQGIVVLSRILIHLAKTHTKLVYHWSELWRSLLSFVRFLTTYVEELKVLPGSLDMVRHLVDLLTQALNNGESFLPDSAAYDDLFYKLVESGEALTNLRTAYGLGKPDDKSSINTLIGVSKHYRELIDEHHKGRTKSLKPKEVHQIIKMGYDTLSLDVKEGLEVGHKFREVDCRGIVKKITRVAVADAASLVAS